MEHILNRIEAEVKADFEKNNRLLTFEEFIHLVKKKPRVQTRGSAEYMVDMMDHFGKQGEHFKLFDMEFESSTGDAQPDTRYRVIAQNDVQQGIYRTLQSFVKEGINNKLILLHGPNGSAKSSIINCMVRGLERYSETPEGACYQFNWIFPVEKIFKGGLGLGTYTAAKGQIDSYAKLSEDDIAAKIPCELKDHPLLLLPIGVRKKFLDELFEGQAEKPNLPDYLVKGSLSHKSKMIFEALLASYKGDLKKVLMHVQVERFYISKRYRCGAVTIEPQLHVDAQSRQVTMDRSLSFLPPSLQSLSLYELSGDLIEGNRGVIEYADLLKRPVDTFKYLLTTCESGSVSVGNAIASLDAVFIGSTNELQLDAFKEFPDFVSFKARLELIRVPYLLQYSEEQKIYDITIRKIGGLKHVAPHTTYVTALWAVLSRLKKPNPIHYPPNLSNIVGSLQPLEKTKLYDHLEMPEQLSAEEKKLLRSSVRKIRDEYSSVPYYEGRMGASAREIKNILHEAAQDVEAPCLSPFTVFKRLDDFVKRVSEYEFLKQDVKDGYHDNVAFIQVVKTEYTEILDAEVRDSMGVFQSSQYEDFLKKYILHLSHLMKKEKIKNSITGKNENPDANLLDEFERIVGAPVGGQERENFRNNVISSIGAYSLDHPNSPLNYRKAFPDYMQRLEDHYFEQQKNVMTKLGDALLLLGSDREDPNSDHHKLALRTLDGMMQKFHYCRECGKQAILFVVRTKY